MNRPEAALEELKRNALGTGAPPPEEMAHATTDDVPATAPPEPAASEPAMADHGGDPGDIDNPITDNISACYHELRRGMAALGFAYPVVLLLVGGLGDIEGSLSAYYHHDDGQTRDIFVGGLWAFGAFLFFYKGYAKWENRALNLAGIMAVAISLAPMHWPAGSERTLVGTLHNVFAITFFLSIAYVCLFEHNHTLRYMRDDARRRGFKRKYMILGAFMILAPLSVFAISLITDTTPNSPVVLSIEVIGVYVFAAYWVTKSKEIAVLENQTDWEHMPPEA